MVSQMRSGPVMSERRWWRLPEQYQPDTSDTVRDSGMTYVKVYELLPGDVVLSRGEVEKVRVLLHNIGYGLRGINGSRVDEALSLLDGKGTE